MVKKFDIEYLFLSGLGTAQKVYSDSNVEILNNSGQTAIRVDKMLSQFSGYHNAVQPMVVGVMVHMTDETGAAFTDAIVNGTTTIAQLEVIMNQWKDLIWMTDLQVLGTGNDETNIFVSNLEAATRRLLNPGQKLLFTMLCIPLATETSKDINGFLDNIVWYSPAAQ